MAELAHLVDEPTRRVLEKAIELGTVIVALSIEDRERILRALEDAPTDALAELSGCAASRARVARPRRTGLAGFRNHPFGRFLYLATGYQPTIGEGVRGSGLAPHIPAARCSYRAAPSPSSDMAARRGARVTKTATQVWCCSRWASRPHARSEFRRPFSQRHLRDRCLQRAPASGGRRHDPP